jgi:hypothetical protein
MKNTENVSLETPEEIQSWKTGLLATLIEDLRETVPMRQFLTFEMVTLLGNPVETVARELGVSVDVVNGTVTKVWGKLRELAALPEYWSEYDDVHPLFNPIAGPVSPEDEAQITRELAEAYRIGMESEQSPEFKRMATKIEGLLSGIVGEH